MKRVTVIVAVLAMLVGLSAVAADRPTLGASKPVVTPRLVQLTVDPITGEVTSLEPLTRGQINTDFAFFSGTCLDCTGTCPPFDRTLRITLDVLNPVANYLPGNLYANNGTLVRVDMGTKAALDPNATPGVQLVMDFTVTVTDCSTHFGIWFDMCSPGDPGGDPTQPCP